MAFKQSYKPNGDVTTANHASYNYMSAKEAEALADKPSTLLAQISHNEFKHPKTVVKHKIQATYHE